jgi:hypothetical protein
VTQGNAFAIGDQRVLFPAGGFLSSSTHRTWEVTADDRRFIFVRSVGGSAAAGPAYVIQVDNWLAELRTATRRR